MSNYIAEAIHPVTGKVEKATFLDDYFGRHQYGVQFDDGTVYRPEQVSAAVEGPALKDGE